VRDALKTTSSQADADAEMQPL